MTKCVCAFLNYIEPYEENIKNIEKKTIFVFYLRIVFII